MIVSKTHHEKKTDGPVGLLLAKYYCNDQALEDTHQNDLKAEISESGSKSDPKVSQTFKTIFKNEQLQKIMVESNDLQN